MANRVKGITIELNGDTTGLDKALRGVNSSVIGVQSQLKDVDRLLKLDPSNTELLAQKQRLLGDAINETKEKLDILYKAQEQAQEQLENGTISQDQYDALQREIIETEQNLRNFESEANNVEDELKEMADGAGDAANKTDELDVSLSSMIKNAAVNLAVDALQTIASKAGEAAKYVIDVGSQFEASMSKVQSISGASSSDLAKLTKKAKEMGRTTKFSASESADAMSYMAMAGWKTNDMLNGIEGVMDLAAASGEDLATTSDIVTDALTAFGLTAKDSGRLADVMAAASSNANTNVSMMGETFKYAAPVAGALGMSMEDTAVAVGLMANAGIKASQAGTSLRTGLTNLAKPTSTMAQAMDEYGISLVENADGSINLRETMVQLREKLGGLNEVQQAAAAGAIFGKNAMSGWLAIINASDEDFDKLATSIDNSTGSAEAMAGTMQDNLSGALTIFWSSVEGLGIAIYDQIVEPLTGAVEFVTGIISSLTTAIEGEDTVMGTFLGDIQESNKEVEKSIKNAQDTVSNAEAKVGELEAYGEEFDDILGQCEEFNLVTLETGEKAIVDASGNIVKKLGEVGTAAEDAEGDLDSFGEDGLKTDNIESDASDASGYIDDIGDTADTVESDLGNFATNGINTSGIQTTTDEAAGMIGYVKEEADTVETRLAEFAKDGIDTTGIEKGKTAVVQVFDEMGVEVENFETDVKESGKVDIDTSGIEEGTSVMITAFSNTSGEVETFKGSLEALGNGEIDLSRIASEFDKVEDSTRKTYVITDEFTKAKINYMVDTLGDSVWGLAEAWNEQTGELTASKEELDKWFDTAKEIALYEALQKSIQEVTEAWSTARVNQIKADSAVQAAQENYDELVKKNKQSMEETGEAYGEYEQEVAEAEKALDDARKTQEACNETEADAAITLKEVTDALEPVKEEYDKMMEGADGAAEATDGATEASEDHTDALDEEEDAVNDTIKALQDEQQVLKDLRDISLDASEKITDAFDEAKESAESAFSVDPFGEWAKNAENGMAKFSESMQSQIDGMLAYRDNLSVVKDNLGETSPEFVKYLEDMGSSGAQLVEDLAQSFRNGDTQAVNDLVAKYEEALDIQEDVTNILAQDALAVQLGLNEMGSTVREWEDLGLAFDDCVAQVQAGGATLAEETTTAFWQAVDNAKAAGVAIPDGLADEIRKSDNPATAIQEATDKLNAAIQGQAQGLLTVANELGINVPEGISTAITTGEGDVTAAYTELLGLIQEKEPDFSAAGTAAGETMASSTVSGMEDNESDVSAAADTIVSAARESADESSKLFEAVGSLAMSSVIGGMQKKRDDVFEKGKSIISIAASLAEVKGKTEFETTGSSVIDSLVTGMEASHSRFVAELDSLNIDAANEFVTLQSTVQSAVEFMKSQMNFSWNLPYLPMPHPWVSGYFSVDPPMVPQFGIDWYKKAMDGGMILDGATIFGMKGNTFLAGGEAGSEAVVGTKSLMSMIRQAVGSSGANIDYGGITMNIYGAEGQDIRALADEIESRLVSSALRQNAVWG